MILERARSALTCLRSRGAGLVGQQREHDGWVLGIQECLDAAGRKGCRVTTFGPVGLGNEQFYIGVLERSRLLSRELVKVWVSDGQSKQVLDPCVVHKTIQTSVISGLILSSKSHYPRNIEGNLSEISKSVAELRSPNRRGVGSMQEVCISLENDVDKLRELARSLGKIFDDLGEEEIPSYDVIAPVEEVIRDLKTQYLILVEDCEVLFAYEESVTSSLSSRDERGCRRIRRGMFFQLQMLNRIMRRLGDLVSRKEAYMSLLLSAL